METKPCSDLWKKLREAQINIGKIKKKYSIPTSTGSIPWDREKTIHQTNVDWTLKKEKEIAKAKEDCNNVLQKLIECLDENEIEHELTEEYCE